MRRHAAGPGGPDRRRPALLNRFIASRICKQPPAFSSEKAGGCIAMVETFDGSYYAVALTWHHTLPPEIQYILSIL